MIGNAFLLAIRQIWRNPLRSILTVLGIVIGVMAVITMVTVGNGASQAIREQIESFGNNQLMLRPGMRLGPGQTVGAPSFKMVMPLLSNNKLLGYWRWHLKHRHQERLWLMGVIGKQVLLVRITTISKSIIERLLKDGYLNQVKCSQGRTVCVIGGTIQKELFGEGAEVIGRTIRTGGFSCRVIGLMKSKGTAAMGGDQDDLLVMPIQTVQRRILGNTRVGALLISVNPQSDRDRLREAVKSLMRERRSLSDGDDDNFQILDTVPKLLLKWLPQRKL